VASGNRSGSRTSPGVRLGLRENLGQFSLLVLVNAFVGGMVGLERTVVSLVGSEQFGLVLRTAIFSFIVTFGLIKAFSNLFAGGLADTLGISWAIGSVAALTFISGAVVAVAMREPKRVHDFGRGRRH
jgi:predicted Co/Zn/Cd cation transporter (cation efflux family)